MIDLHELKPGFSLKRKREIKKWLKTVLCKEGKELAQLDYIFSSDEHLLNLNREYLNHDFYTDIISFDYADNSNIISGDVFISVDRVHENASKLNIHKELEMNRVILHGLLHLIGYTDKTSEEKKIMSQKEDTYLMDCP